MTTWVNLTSQTPAELAHSVTHVAAFPLTALSGI
jgi:hypothetical protein